jgi:hypothetical protein
MIHRFTYLTRTIFTATCMAVGCTSSGTFGCGSNGGEEDLTIDSNLPAVYQITSYQGNEDGCDQVTDVPNAPSHLVLYAFHPNSAPSETRMGGAFCGGVDECRTVAEFAGEPARGYSFIIGDDTAGWTGYGIVSNGSSGNTDECQAEVQVHALASPGGNQIRIETKTVETTYDATVDGTTATCANADAIASINDDLPCTELIVLEGTREAEL